MEPDELPDVIKWVDRETEKVVGMVSPIKSFMNEHGTRYYIIKDDNCYLVMIPVFDKISSKKLGYSPTQWIFPEALTALSEIFR